MSRNCSELDAARFGYALGREVGMRDERAAIVGEVAEQLLEAGHELAFIGRLVRTIRSGAR